jgi:hypothetical protein
MVQIYQDRPSFASQLAGATTNVLGQFGEAFAKQKLEQRKKQELSTQSDLENEQIKSNFGIDLSGIKDPKTRELILAEKLKGQNQGHGMSGASKALDTMEGLIDKEGIGFMEQSDPFPGARQNRGEFEALQSAIVPIFKSMFPRGMTEKEFKFINDHYMPQVGETRAKMRGKIKGLRQLMQQQSPDQQMMSNEDVLHMIDDQGNEYDIPSNLYEKAIAKGFRKK